MTLPKPPTPDRKLRILLCGYGHLGLALLQGLWECAEDCELVGVFRWSSRPDSSNCWEPVEGQFQQQIERFGLTDIRCKGINTYEFTTLLQSLKPDVLLVGSWGEIIKQHLIEHPGLLLVNCHPSKLPAHRGANPYSSVIIHGETETGVTFHRIAPKIDAGAIILQQTVPLEANDNGATVRDKCSAAAYEMVKPLVERLKAHLILGHPLEEEEQDHATHSYFPQLKPDDGVLDWNASPDAMCRLMRGLFPWIACSSYLEGRLQVVFYDPQFVWQSPATDNGVMPGTILSFERGKLCISLSDPSQRLEVRAYQFGLGKTLCPMWLTTLIAPFVLRVGKRFRMPPAKKK